MHNLLLAAETDASQGMSAMALLVNFAPFILIIIAFYFLLIRPQKKKEKAIQDMRSKVEVGDEIVTVGGIIGRVVNIKDETLVLETGSDRNKVRIARWAIQTNNTVHDDTPSA